MNTNMNTYIHKETCGHTYMHHYTRTCSWHPRDWGSWILNVEGKKYKLLHCKLHLSECLDYFSLKVGHKAAFAA